ncbi:MAG TPA: hypothetical protein ENJ60_09810 [Aeromonadales bacterium]|nr:hypothetical protein [Aeromonadales bacterium]
MQNHYKVLGLTPDVEVDVIRAAYRALSRKYHPDRYNGDENHANELMKKINVAYEILSNTEKRAEFDNIWGHSDDYQESEQNEEKYSAAMEIDDDWNFALEYYPALESLYSRLYIISPQIAYGFKILIIDTQEFSNPQKIAKKIEVQFLQKYFGLNIRIQNVALKYIMCGNRIAAKELNKAVNVFGNNIDVNKILSKISKKYPIEDGSKKHKEDIQEEGENGELERRFFKFLIAFIFIFFLLAMLSY